MTKNSSVCSSNRFEISEKKGKDGRRNVRIILHEIFQDNTVWQDNGISWSEENTLKNLETISGMSICCQFIDDDKSIPLGHGMTDVKDGIPIFEDATMVGVFDKGAIEDIVVDGEQIRACIAYGHIDEMRSPHFVDWLEEKIKDNTIYGSVEIIGRPENNNEIVYEHGYVEKGRIPKEYIYSGYAILSIKPADKKSIVIELNNQNKECEDYIMDDKVIQEIKTCIVNSVSEMNSNKEVHNKQISELNEKMQEKDTDIDKKNKEIEELNERCKTLQEESAKKDEDMKKKDTEINSLMEKNNEMLKSQKKSELNSILSEYSDSEKAFAKDEIASFETDPLSVEINSITDKIDREIVKHIKETAKKNVSEMNSAQSDIFACVGDVNANKNDSDSIF